MMMRAAYLTGHGGNEVVMLGERPKPIRRAGEVLVKLEASGLNRVDLYMRDSGAGITHSLPLIMGLDGAGCVVDADDEASGLRAGDAVVIHPGIACGRCEFCQRGDSVLCAQMRFAGEHCDGTLAQFIAPPRSNVFRIPAGLSAIEAAALSCAPATAFRMVFTRAAVKPWETVLIFGIGGAVSLSALQLVKRLGARAIVTSRDPAKLERALALGADAAIEDGREDIARRALALTEGRGVDVVIENVGEAVWPAAMKSLVRGGRIVTCGATSGDAPSADLRRLFIRQLQVLGSTHATLEEFRQLLALSGTGGFRPIIDRVHPLAELHAALDHLASSRQFGKVGITITA